VRLFLFAFFFFCFFRIFYAPCLLSAFLDGGFLGVPVSFTFDRVFFSCSRLLTLFLAPGPYPVGLAVGKALAESLFPYLLQLWPFLVLFIYPPSFLFGFEFLICSVPVVLFLLEAFFFLGVSCFVFLLPLFSPPFPFFDLSGDRSISPFFSQLAIVFFCLF